MVKILDADLVKQHFIITHEGKRVELVKEHFVITDDGQRALLDLSNPYVINDDNKNSIPKGEIYLQDARHNIDPTISEIRGLEYFAQRQVLFDSRKVVIMVADQSDEISPPWCIPLQNTRYRACPTALNSMQQASSGTKCSRTTRC